MGMWCKGITFLLGEAARNHAPSRFGKGARNPFADAACAARYENRFLTHFLARPE
jgi:hypothetical protein